MHAEARTLGFANFSALQATLTPTCHLCLAGASVSWMIYQPLVQALQRQDG